MSRQMAVYGGHDHQSAELKHRSVFMFVGRKLANTVNTSSPLSPPMGEAKSFCWGQLGVEMERAHILFGGAHFLCVEMLHGAREMQAAANGCAKETVH